ncbi:acetylornithine deacetylase [Alkanindiges sp. WGS2144]|uniref:acetylornithine deacetylase n=1 Tax=Alkanindiges sp. WGS2144 TaxID=3366808 RepID=UPI0037507766
MLKPRLRQQLAQLTATPSISCTMPDQDMSNLPVIEILANWFESAGFNCEIMPVAPGKANLIAVRPGLDPEARGGLVLAGHSDTVPFDQNLWQSDPFNMVERDGKLFGLGMADMKGFFALVHEAAASYAKTPLRAPLIVIATCDEETSMAGARALMEQAKGQGRFVLIGEPTGLKPARLHKGVMLERVVVTGQSGHSSDPELGRNAIDAMHEVISRLQQFRSNLKKIQQPIFPVPYPTLNLGCIHGGDNPNRICGLCELQFDIRPLPGMDIEHIRADIHQLLQGIEQQFGVSMLYEPATAGSAPAETPASSPFVQKIESLLGEPAGAVAFGTEAPYFRAQGMDAVILGPGNIEQAHQPDEYLEIKNISPMVLLLNQLIHYYCVQGHARF